MPRPRGEVPPAQAARLVEAIAARDRSDAELRAAVRAALDAGGSVREVARLTGLSTSTVQHWSTDR